MRRTLGQLTTRRLDGRSAIAVAVRTWKADIRRDLGDDLTRAQESVLEAAAQTWVILASVDDYIARQSSLVTKKRRVLDVVTQRMQIAEGLAKHLQRLGLERRSRNVPDLTMYLASKAPGGMPTPSSEPATVQPPSELHPSSDGPPATCEANADSDLAALGER